MDVPEITVENIEKAVHQLYYDQSPAVKDAAQRWLTCIQRSKQAWQFAWDLLQQGRQIEVQYFGASALVSKITGSWNEVPENEINSLRDRLFSEILRLCVATKDKIVLTRVCVAFSSFAMNCITTQKWASAIVDIIKKFQDDSITEATPIQRCAALLEILTVLAEEQQSRTMERYQKGIVKHVLIQGMPQVLPLLNNLLSAEDFQPVHGKVLKCFASWVVLGIPLDENRDFLCRALTCLNNPDLFDTSVECLLNTFCAPETIRYPNTIKNLVPKILSLRPMLHRAIEEHDADICLGITKIICGLAENQTKLIVENFSNSEMGLGLVLMVADCTGIRLQYPTEELSSPITFTFWYSIQDEVRNLPKADGPIYSQFQPIFYHLVETLVRKASYPSDDSHTNWSSDEKEQHRIYRIDISDTLMYVLEMLGPNMINFLCSKLSESVHTMHQAANYLWQEVEALLFAIHSVVESTGDWEDGLECLHEFAQLLATIKVENVTLAGTLLYSIGALTDWLVYNPQYLQNLVSFVLPCLRTHELAMVTVLTVKRITRECKAHLLPVAENILNAAQDALIKGILKNVEVNWLMQSVGHVLSVLPEEQCLRQLQSVLMLHMHQLQALSEDAPSVPTKHSIIHILEILTSLFSTLDRRKKIKDGDKTQKDVTEGKPPVLLILEQITPILQGILNRWVSDVAIVQVICDLYDRAIRNLLDGFAPLLPTLCDMLTKIFQTAPQTSVLDLTQQLTLVYANDSTHIYCIGTLFHAINETCRQMFGGRHAAEHPDLAQGYLKLLTHILRKNQNMIFEEIAGNPSLPPPDLNLLIHCALATLALPESESVKSSCSFLIGLIGNFRHGAESVAAVETNGKELFIATMKAIGGQAVRTVMDNVADVLFALMKYNAQAFTKWVHESQSIPDFPAPNLDKSKKAMFFKQLLHERTNRRKYRDIIREFSLICRGIHGTEYAMG